MSTQFCYAFVRKKLIGKKLDLPCHAHSAISIFVRVAMVLNVVRCEDNDHYRQRRVQERERSSLFANASNRRLPFRADVDLAPASVVTFLSQFNPLL
jgi:hypothetical protein